MPVSPYPTFPRKREKGQTNRYASYTLNSWEATRVNVKVMDRHPCTARNRPQLNLCATLTPHGTDNTIHEAFNKKLIGQIILQCANLGKALGADLHYSHII